MFAGIVEKSLMATMIGAFVVLCLLSPVLAQQSGQGRSEIPADEFAEKIQDAKNAAAEWKAVLSERRRLAEMGSVSKQELRAADYQYKLAELAVISLEYPGMRQRIAVLCAKLDFDFRSKEFEMMQNLYRRGSISVAAYLRARTARDVAKLNFEVARGGGPAKLHDVRIAMAKLALARDLYDRAAKLYRSGSVSRPVFERVRRNLNVAEEELVLARKMLGIRVIRVPESDITPMNNIE